MSEFKPDTTRRTIMLGVVTLPIAGLSTARATEGAGMVAESDELAVQLGYKEDASKVDAAKFPKRAGAEGATQFCQSCQFYQAPGEQSAPCVVFGGKKVTAKGWCSSWFKRA